MAQEVGLADIWGSGFELSASYTVHDTNILSTSTQLEVMRAMASVASIPLVADIGTGFGDTINFSYFVSRDKASGASAS